MRFERFNGYYLYTRKNLVFVLFVFTIKYQYGESPCIGFY